MIFSHQIWKQLLTQRLSGKLYFCENVFNTEVFVQEMFCSYWIVCVLQESLIMPTLTTSRSIAQFPVSSSFFVQTLEHHCCIITDRHHGITQTGELGTWVSHLPLDFLSSSVPVLEQYLMLNNVCRQPLPLRCMKEKYGLDDVLLHNFRLLQKGQM